MTFAVHQGQGKGGAGMPQPAGMHLVEYNFGTLRHGWDDPRSAAFVAGLDLVNGIAAASPGFVWRETEDDLGTSGASAADLTVEDQARMAADGFAATLSVWASVEDLEHFVWNTVHRQFYGRKAEWYDAIGNGNLVLWWAASGTRPRDAEGMARWRHRETHGDSDHAFGWSYLKEAQLWRAKACDRGAASSMPFSPAATT